MSDLVLAARVRRTAPSPIAAAARRAAELRLAGQDIIDLTIGEPDFDTPDYIKTAAKEAIDAGLTKYTAIPGTLDLRRAISDSLFKDNGVRYEPTQIIVSNGAKQVLYLILGALVDRGDEVIIPTPYFPSYPEMVNIFGGTSVFVGGDEGNNFKISPTALAGALTPKTKILLLNSPNNPGGGIYDASELRRLAEVLAGYPRVFVVSDEIYQHVQFGAGAPSLTAAAPALIDRSLIVNGVAKTYAMTGWRIGYGAGPAAVVTAMSTLQSHVSSGPSSISQAASAAALRGDQSFLKEWIQSYEVRRDLGVRLLNEIPGVHCQCPDGAFYLYANCSGILGKKSPSGSVVRTDSDLADYFLDSAGVAVVPGVAYGRSPFFRVSVAASIAEITQGCRRLRMAVAQLD